jgi:hypothetical protein
MFVDIPQDRHWGVTPTMRIVVAGVCLIAFLVKPSTPAFADGEGNDARLAAPIDFNIPSQTLGMALVAFGAKAGFDLYYNAALAEGRRSAAVTGKLAPTLALQRLLQGTGLLARMTGPSSLILVPAAPEAANSGEPALAGSGRFEPYFATIQGRISEALCHSRAAAIESKKILLRVWLADSGTIDQVELLGAGVNEAVGRSLSDAVRGLAIGTPPPEMPQPLTLVVFPPSATRQECRSSDALPAAN